MASVYITLKKDHKGMWTLHAPKGHVVGGPFRGSRIDAVEWARRFISTWQDWVLKTEIDDAQEDRMPRPPICSTEMSH